MSFAFFTLEYFTNWLEVVTLGGLIAGSFMMGTFMTSLCYLTDRRVITYIGVLCFLNALCYILPGYTLHDNYPHLIIVSIIMPECTRRLLEWKL